MILRYTRLNVTCSKLKVRARLWLHGNHCKVINVHQPQPLFACMLNSPFPNRQTGSVRANHSRSFAESFLEYDTKRQLPDHMKVILLKADLGCGRSVYKCAKAHLLKWNLHAGSQTAGIMTKADTRGRPEYLATFAKTLGGLA
eukprot:14434-Heterococcus_DN1.PRE.1